MLSLKYWSNYRLQMSFTTTVFSELTATYQTWDALRLHLMSAEGGKLRVMTMEHDDLAIIRYTKGTSDFKKAHVPYFRSVVWSKSLNKPVCVSPIKAEFGNVAADVAVRITDFVDGTMINAFRTSDGIRIATRSSLDARGTFYSARSFADLFDDAFRAVGGTTKFLESVLFDNEFASFVLQHPEHKTVLSISQPRVYVTYFGSVADSVKMTANPSSWPERLASYAPQVYNEGLCFEKPAASYQMMRDQRLGYSWQGMVFQELDGSRRWRIRNPAYTAVRTLRGSESNAMERFLRLRSEGTVKKYLEHFRDESNEMWAFEKSLRERTQELYNAYTDMNKLKTKTMKQLPYCLRPHVYALHGLYLAKLPKDGTRAPKDSVKPIMKDTVVAYVNDLSLEDQLTLLKGDRVPFVEAVAAAEPAPAEEVELDEAEAE